MSSKFEQVSDGRNSLLWEVQRSAATNQHSLLLWTRLNAFGIGRARIARQLNGIVLRLRLADSTISLS